MGFDAELALRLLPEMALGGLVTLSVVLPALVLGFPLALLLALGRMSRRQILRTTCLSLTIFFRGAPALILLYMIYHGLPLLGFVRNSFLWAIFQSPYVCAVLGFTLNHAGYLSEILFGSLAAVPKGTIEAGRALALPDWLLFLRIRLALALRTSLSAYQNEVILLTKGTAAVSAITMMDILGRANEAVSISYDSLTPLIMAGLAYWIIIQAELRFFALVSRRLSRHERPLSIPAGRVRMKIGAGTPVQNHRI